MFFFVARMIRLDGDQRLKSRLRSSPASSSFLSVINDEIHQLPAEVFSIERISVSRALKSQPAETIGPNKTGVVLRCKLLGMPNPLVPALRLHVSTSYPEQAPEILSLTKTSRPELEFSGEKQRKSLSLSEANLFQRDIPSSNRSPRSSSLVSFNYRLNIRSVIFFIFG